MEPEIVRVVVPPALDGSRLDQVLARLVPGRSRAQLQRLIQAGAVDVAGTPHPRASTPVRSGATIAVSLPRPRAARPTAEPLPVGIVYQDADLVVVDKPAGLVVHPAAGHAAGTLVNALLHHIGDLSGIGGERRPGIVHRLDRGTSGLLVVAKHDRAHVALARQFKERTVTKEYAVLVWGHLPAGRVIDAPIGRHPTDRKRMSTRAGRGRAAVTRVLRAEPLGPVSLLRVAIATGRTHQIRVHLSAAGCPVVGDPVYGGRRRQLPGSLRALDALERPFLHAERLSITQPSSGERLTFVSDLPEDLARAVASVRAAVRAADRRSPA